MSYINKLFDLASLDILSNDVRSKQLWIMHRIANDIIVTPTLIIWPTIYW